MFPARIDKSSFSKTYLPFFSLYTIFILNRSEKKYWPIIVKFGIASVTYKYPEKVFTRVDFYLFFRFKTKEHYL